MAKKEKATIDLEGFDVKLADGKKSKKDKADRLTIESPIMEVPNPAFNATKKASETNPATIKIPVVDRCVELSQAIENLEAEMAIYEGQLTEKANSEKNAAADDDQFVKTVDITGTTLKVQIQFRDAYSKMDAGMKAPLVQIFGDKFPIMFIEQTDYAFREFASPAETDTKIKELKALLGDKFDTFFDTDKYIKPTKDFQQTFFTLRKSFKPDQLAVVEKVKAATQSKPAVKYPK